MAVAGNEDDAVNVLQEGWIPVRCENISVGGAGVPQCRGIYFLSRLVIRVIGEG